MKRRLRILLFEQGLSSFELVQPRLEEDGLKVEWRRAKDLEEFGRHLKQAAEDVVLLEYHPVNPDAEKIQRLLQALPQQVPLIWIGRGIDENSLVQQLGFGIRDYVLLENVRRLAPAIERGLLDAENLKARLIAESALRAMNSRKSQRMLSLFFHQGLDGYYLTDLDIPQEWNESTDKERVLDYVASHQRITHANDAMLVQYGATREEFLGRTVGEFFKHDAASGRHLRRRLFDQGRLHVETLEQRDDGTDIWIEGDYACIYDDQHRITGTFGIQRDITERKRLEREREAALVKYQALFNAFPLGITVADGAGNIVEANPMAAQLLGLSAEGQATRHVGSPEWHFLRPDGTRMPPEEFPGVRALAHGRRVENFEFGLVRSPVETLWLTVTAAPVRLPEVGLVLAYADITESKRSAAALRESEDRYRLLVEESPDGIGIYQNGRLVFVNSTGVRQLGAQTKEELLGRQSKEILHPEDQAAALERIHRRLAGDATVYPAEVRYVRLDGTILPVEVSATPVQFAGRNGIQFIARDISERKRAEAALRESVLLRREVEKMARIGAWKVNPQTNYLYMTEGILLILDAPPGYGPELSEVMKLYDPEFLPILESALQTTWKESIPFRLEARLTTLKGRQLWVEVRGVGCLEEEGQFYVVGTFQDITERKDAEGRAARDALRTKFLLELHQQAAQMSDRALFDHVLERAVELTSSSIGFFHQVADDQQEIILTTWNKEALRNCTADFEAHYPVNQAGNWVDCIRERRPVVYNDYENSPHQKGLPLGHATVRRFMSIPVIRDGKVRIIFGVGNKVTDYDQEDVTQLQVVANELHKVMSQRAAQVLLWQSEQRFRHLVETTCDWIWEVDVTGRYTFASPRVKDILGYAPGDVVGRMPGDFLPAKEAERVVPLLQELVGARKSFSNFEKRTLHRMGREVIVESSGVPVLGEQGELVGYRGMDRDITQRKRLESQLRQAQKLEAIGQLAGGVAHDFNNILAAIMMQLGLLQIKPHVDPETKEALKELENGARRAASLTNQLLMFSRRSVLEVRPLDLNDVVQNMLKMLCRLIGEHFGLAFEGYTGELPLINADVGMIEQVLMNLVVNARDAMPKGGKITIGTRVENLDEASSRGFPERYTGRFVCLTVSDTGVGMDKETLEHIFEPFFTTKEPGRGTGLGLATVHGIVAQHKGWIEVDTEPGHGTTFRVYLPALTRGSPRKEAVEESLRRGRETILVVEDDIDVRRTVVEGLRFLGYRVYEAENGQQAMSFWQQHEAEVDLLFTDMVMPEGITGLELAERLLAMKTSLRVIISSGYSAEIVQSGGIKQSGILYLPKPYKTSVLAEKIRTCLDSR